MVHRLGEIPCGMLARTAVQPRVLAALIQCATMAKYNLRCCLADVSFHIVVSIV